MEHYDGDRPLQIYFDYPLLYLLAMVCAMVKSWFADPYCGMTINPFS